MQFHPEVLHTQQGARMLSNFVYNVCGCKGTWKMDSFVDDTVAALRARVGGGRVLCALSGGVDSSVAAVLLGQEPVVMTGRGAGLSDAGLQKKIHAIETAVAVNRPDPADVLDVLHKVGGLDIAGLAGVFLGGALCHTPVLVDGFISSVAALVAARLCPACKDYMLGSHASEEPASRLVLSELGLRPFLYAGMRLGEGTGAVAVMPLLDMALAVYREMATFEDTNIEAYQPLG